MKKKIILIIFLIFSVKIYAESLYNKDIEKQIIQEHPELQKEYYKQLYLIQSNLMNLENRINYLHYILQDKLNNRAFKSRLDPTEKLERAKRHLLLGNSQAAIDEVNRNFKYIDYGDEKNISLANKILFESNRIQGKFDESANICSKMIILGYKDKNYFEDKWKMLCSYSFLQSSKKNGSEEFAKNLIVWSLNPFVADNSQYSLLSEIFISLALRNMDRNNTNSIKYLDTSISKAKEKDIFLGKAYLTLALLYFEEGKKDKAFTIIQDIALNSSLKGKEYKYFEADNYTRLLAKLCFARLHAIYGNLQAAETWYEDVLRENKVTGGDFANNEKNKIKYEYGQVLYKQKKYIKSEIAFKSLVNQVNPTNLFLSPYNVKISRIILANILNKSLDPAVEPRGDIGDGDVELTKLYNEANADLEFIKKNDGKMNQDYDSVKNKIIPLAALAKAYGLESKEAKYFIQSYLSLEILSKNIPKNKFDFVNALNSIDYSDKGISESIVISCINQINKNFSLIRTNVFKLDEISAGFWDKKSNLYQIASNNRDGILNRLNAINDAISDYNNDVVLKYSIYKGDLIRNLIQSNKKINQTKALNAGVDFLSSLRGSTAESSNVQLDQAVKPRDDREAANIVMDSVLNYRKSILENEIFPTIFYSINKKFDVYSDSLSKIYSLHKSLRVKVDSFVNEPYNLLDDNWNKLIELNSLNNKLLRFVIDKLESDRKETLERVHDINHNLIVQEDSIKSIKNSSFEEFKKYYPILSTQLTKKIQEFNGYIQLSLATHNKNIYEMNKHNLNDEIILKEERNKWIESLQKSLDWELFR